ncbi:MAG: 50S ribosomal protein L3 [Verrucomicrobia bacterium]|nr:50S ribosomal protein L3 [Verrucomicrobiota bacterium]MDA1064948.1 50S ribosomal protein L3 [Verrucomicrobiota bacterium]
MLHTLIAKKVGMTQVYDAENCLVPVTVFEAGPCPVTQVKTEETDGYNAVQIGYIRKKTKNMTAGQIGHLSKASLEGLSQLREIRCTSVPEVKVGDTLTVSGFVEGAKVDVVGTTKGRGFQGVVKRWNVKGGPASHGSMFHRRIGSIGLCQDPGHVFKGQIMPGHMGDKQRTVQNLKVVKIYEDKNLILVKGSTPGFNGSQVLIRTSKKTRTARA